MLVRLRKLDSVFFPSGSSRHLSDYLIVSGRDAVEEDLVVRCIHLADRSFESRRKLVDIAFPGVDHQRFDRNDTALFSSVNQQFDVLLLHGDDERRMAQGIRGYMPLLHSKVKIAFMSLSNPPARAILLNAGFDEVFDGRSTQEDISCRVGAIVRRIRYREAVELRNSGDIDWDLVNRHSQERLTRREAELFLLLFRSFGEKVPFSKLANSQISQNKSKSRRALSVAMCKIRKKLDSDLDIISCYDGGYLIKSKSGNVYER
ncbi:MAG TPA: winged helix-turn-helix domain-containing protein [Novosphingobium sp.]|nr:winged helix-turn-helix domain-containing protein [Novosphingobium sp.]HMP55417.1 winged helix-turn-helix domain-containing protein [Novosphingobium sp.]